MKQLRRPLLVATLFACVGVWAGLLWLARSYEEEPYTRIEDGLYLGKAVPQPPPGTRAVVNLCGARDPYTVEASLWEPILEGGDDPTVEWLRRVVEFIGAQRRPLTASAAKATCSGRPQH